MEEDVGAGALSIEKLAVVVVVLVVEEEVPLVVCVGLRVEVVVVVAVGMVKDTYLLRHHEFDGKAAPNVVRCKKRS